MAQTQTFLSFFANLDEDNVDAAVEAAIVALETEALVSSGAFAGHEKEIAAQLRAEAL